MNHINKKIITLFTSLLLLNGCAVLSREACMRGSWYELGTHDYPQLPNLLIL